MLKNTPFSPYPLHLLGLEHRRPFTPINTISTLPHTPSKGLSPRGTPPTSPVPGTILGPEPIALA